MSFEPHKAEHAIESALFALHFDQPPAESDLEKLFAGKFSWRDEFPASSRQPVVQLVPKNDVMAHQQPDPSFVYDFSYHSPNGTALWSVRLWGNQLLVETSRYTRWAPTWAKVKKVVEDILFVFSSSESKDLKIVNSQLTVIDLFYYRDDTAPNYRSLFQTGSELAPNIFDRGVFWHSHTGWFENESDVRILNQLNIDIRPPSIIAQSGPVNINNADIYVIHNQMTSFVSGALLISNNSPVIVDRIFGSMHQRNKRVISSVVTKDMQDRIGLNAN